MVSIAVVGSDPIAHFLVTHLIYHNYHPQCHPDNVNKILFITGFPNSDIDLNNAKHIKIKTFDDYEISVSRDEINYTNNLKKLVEFKPDYLIITLRENQISEVLQEIVELDGKTVVGF